MLQTIVERTVDVVFCSGVLLETIYCIVYIVLGVSDFVTPFSLCDSKSCPHMSTKVIEYNCTDKITRSPPCRNTPPLATP